MKAKIKCMRNYRTILCGVLSIITCYPEEIWEYKIDGGIVILSRNNTTIKILIEDFERNWTKIES